MGQNQTSLLQGTLDLLILKAIGESEFHGARDLAPHRADHSWNFPGKARLALPCASSHGRSGLLTSFRRESENNRRAKYYKRTKSDDRQLGIETEQWTTIVQAMANALKSA